MTTLLESKKKCAICGHEQKYTEVGSTNTFGGYMDLDTRPPQMKRSTLIYDIQMCEKCAYSNGDISELISGINSEDLKTANYKAVFNDGGIDEHAKAFLLAGYLYQRVNQHMVAGIYYLNAAWVFDDSEDKDHAKRARNKAIDNISKYVEESADINFGAMTVDLYRRNGRFKEAKETAEQLIDYGVEDILKKVLKLQIRLCDDNDDSCHTVEETL